MFKKDQIKLDLITDDLMLLVSAGRLDAAFVLLEQTLGSYDERGWGWPMAVTVGLMQRIMAICPGDEGIELAVKTLCGQAIYNQRRNYWTQAVYEQSLDDARRSGFTKGLRITPGNSPCAAAKVIAGCYRLEDAPRLPSNHCTNEFGCTCGWENIFDDEEPPSPWQKLRQ